MKALDQLKQYGFIITPALEKILKKLPADTFNQVQYSPGKDERRAVIWCDKANKTDIIIKQKI